MKHSLIDVNRVFICANGIKVQVGIEKNLSQVYIKTGNDNWYFTCCGEDIDKLIESLYRIKKEIEVVCEFEFNNTKYRVINENGAYVLYFLEDNGLDSWLIYYWKIHHELFDAIIKALINKE